LNMEEGGGVNMRGAPSQRYATQGIVLHTEEGGGANKRGAARQREATPDIVLRIGHVQ
jgi:hypothetical protein